MFGGRASAGGQGALYGGRTAFGGVGLRSGEKLEQGVLRYADLSVLISFLNLRKRYEIAGRFILMMQMGFNPGMFQIGNHIEQLLIFSQRYQLLQARQRQISSHIDSGPQHVR